MSSIIKPLGVSNTCNSISSNSYGNASLVRITHIDNANSGHTVYCYSNTGSLKYSVVVCGGESVILEKSPTDNINSSSTDTTLRIVPIAYKN
jgi:hypothetical protein